MWLKFECAFSVCSSPDQHKTLSSLAVSAFACSVISCSELSSRGYLVTSDDSFVCSVISYLEVKQAVFENWFINPQKRTETRGKKFLQKNFIWSRDGAEKSIETRWG